MRRVVILGRGGAGKSTTAAELGRITGLPVVELDKHFWSPTLEPLPLDDWRAVQRRLAAADDWIMDGDLGPYDDLRPRLQRSDTVVILDLSLVRCVCRALRRSRERMDFWRWVLTWRWRSRPAILRAVAEHAPTADLRVLRTPRRVRRFLDRPEAASPERPDRPFDLGCNGVARHRPDSHMCSSLDPRHPAGGKDSAACGQPGCLTAESTALTVCAKDLRSSRVRRVPSVERTSR